MPFEEQSVSTLREAFVLQASAPDANVSALCRAFHIGRRTGYRWLDRYRCEGLAGLSDRSRRPRVSPRRTGPAIEALIVALRLEQPTWGGRKIAQRLTALGFVDVPSPSTITAVLRRHDLLDGPGAGTPRGYVRFEHAAPNDLWQMDYKGHVACGAGRCHPLNVLDDHSRFNLALRACADERTETVRDALIAIFREYGLPRCIGCDNGAPWSSAGGSRYTALVVWLLRVGVAL